MLMMSQMLSGVAQSRYQTSICFCRSALARTAGKCLTKYQPSMDAIHGNTITSYDNRDVSHPNLIEIEPVTSLVNPECSNIALIKAFSTKPTKSLIWISA